MNVLVLGCGLVGRPMALDLANDESFNVTVADINLKNLKKFPRLFQLKKDAKRSFKP